MLQLMPYGATDVGNIEVWMINVFSKERGELRRVPLYKLVGLLHERVVWHAGLVEPVYTLCNQPPRSKLS